MVDVSLPEKISIIIPCYFANEDLISVTERCLHSLMPTTLEVIIVDDGSPLKPEFIYDIKIIEAKENGGYAKAVNAGLKESTGEILIVCNNDVEFFDPHWLKQLIKPLFTGYDISSVRTTDSDGWEVEDKITEGDKFGSIWAMKRSTYEILGGLDEGYGKGYFEDLDYHRRAEQNNLKIGKNHASFVYHAGKHTFKAIDPIDLHFYEARDKFVAKWGTDKL